MNRSDSPKKQPKPFGVNGQRVAILPTTPAGDNSASYEQGFPPITMILKSAGGLPPKGQDMNQILYELSALGRWSSTGALNTFDSEFASEISGYPSGAMLISDDGERIFINTTEGNLSDPNSNGAGWKDILSYLGLGTGLTGIVGQSRNATISIIAPSASSTFKADELIVQTALGGTQYKLTNVNVTGSLSAVGAGGVDVAGTVPTTGYMAKYVIYNPQSGAEALLYQNATSAKVPEVYSGTAMPAGYTASALVSIWPVNGLQFAVGNQKGRKVSIPVSTIVATTSSTTSGNSTVGTFTSNLIPFNAVLIDGNCIILANGGQQAEVSLPSVPVPGTGLRFAINAIASAVSMGNAQCFSNYPIYTPQSVLIYAFSTNGTTFDYTITINGYTF